jgi:hypothetical protein
MLAACEGKQYVAAPEITVAPPLDGAMIAHLDAMHARGLDSYTHAANTVEDTRDLIQIPMNHLRDLGPRVRAMSSESAASTGSQANFARPEETLIIFDWDDTLCPSYWVKQVGLTQLGPDGIPVLYEEYRPLLRELMEVAEASLSAAERAGKVVIVTNAETGWIELSCKRWLPDLLPVLDRFDIISARSTWEPTGLKQPVQWKSKEFEKVISKFYTQRLHQSWKNVLSIGDSPHERDALRTATRGGLHTDRRKKRCRTKTIKFKVRPTAEELVQELCTLAESMEYLVCHDDHLDICLGPDSPSPAIPPYQVEQYTPP